MPWCIEGNGLPDWWQWYDFESLYNNPNSSPDGNGLTLMQDYQQGNNPLNLLAVDSPLGKRQQLFEQGARFGVGWLQIRFHAPTVPFRVPRGNREVGLLNGAKRRKNTVLLACLAGFDQPGGGMGMRGGAVCHRRSISAGSSAFSLQPCSSAPRSRLRRRGLGRAEKLKYGKHKAEILKADGAAASGRSAAASCPKELRLTGANSARRKHGILMDASRDAIFPVRGSRKSATFGHGTAYMFESYEYHIA